MDIHRKKPIDPEAPLSSDAQEKFCNEYVRLDIEEGIVNKRARRIRAYRLSFPETNKDNDGVINSKATALLNRSTVRDRIRKLYEEEGTSVENEFNWTKSKSENVLLEIVYNEDLKTADRLKAISELNKMRGIDAPTVEEDKSDDDEIDSYFNSLGNRVDDL